MDRFTRCSPPAFDTALSYRLDRIIIALDQCPRQPRQAWLRVRKALAECGVPAYAKAGLR